MPNLEFFEKTGQHFLVLFEKPAANQVARVFFKTGLGQGLNEILVAPFLRLPREELRSSLEYLCHGGDQRPVHVLVVGLRVVKDLVRHLRRHKSYQLVKRKHVFSVKSRYGVTVVTVIPCAWLRDSTSSRSRRMVLEDSTARTAIAERAQDSSVRRPMQGISNLMS